MHVKSKWITPPLFFAATFTAFIAALGGKGRIDQLLLVWPVSGAALALLLPYWRASVRDKASFLLAIFSGVVAGGQAVSMPLPLSLLLAALTCIDLAIACSLMAPHIQCFEDLKRGANMVRFGIAAILAPLVTSLLGAMPVSAFLHQPSPKTMEAAFLANSLGLGLVFPPVLLLVYGGRKHLARLRPYARPAALPVFLFLAITGFVFYQNFGPFLFLVFPPMILLLLILGLEGAVFASVVVSAVGWFATAHGRGPLWLIHRGQPIDRLIALQMFIWVCISTAMPIGALLDDQRRAQKRASEATSIYQTILQNTEDLIVLASMSGGQRFVSPAIQLLTGWTPQEYLALGRLGAVHPEDRTLAQLVLESLSAGKREHTVRYRMLRKAGDSRWVEASVRAYSDATGDQIAGYVSTIRDITSLKEAEAAWLQERANLALDRQLMQNLAHTDALTGVLNRRGFDEAFKTLLLGQRDAVALLLMDVDFFKSFNDTYGHPAGDACLSRLARVFAARPGRAGDIVARLGGEEFAILLPGADGDGALKVAEEVLQGVRHLAIEHGQGIAGIVTVSIGVALMRADAQLDASLLLQQADRALYLSKRRGRDTATRAEALLAAGDDLGVGSHGVLAPPFAPINYPAGVEATV